MSKIYLFKRHYEEVLQNEYNMNDSLGFSAWKLCPTASVGSLKLPYVCYLTESCCKTGCCTVHTYPHFKSWYFWLIVILVFGILYCCVWYCKRMERLRKNRQREEMSNGRFSAQSPSSSPRAFCLIDLEQCHKTVTFDQKDPPKYEEALSMPRTKSIHVADVHVYEDSGTQGLPTYDDVKKNTENKF